MGQFLCFVKPILCASPVITVCRDFYIALTCHPIVNSQIARVACIPGIELTLKLLVMPIGSS